MAKTKIIATLGPPSARKDVMLNMVKEGVTIFRLNFSYRNDEFPKLVEQVREIEHELKIPIGIMADLQGPKVRIDKLPQSPLLVEKGERLTLRGKDGDDSSIVVGYEALEEEVKKGTKILLEDGKVVFEVEEVKSTGVRVRVLEGGEIKLHSGVSIPGGFEKLPPLTQKDIEDIKDAVDWGVDFFAISFVRSEDDIRMAREKVKEHGGNQWIIAKIETKSAVERATEIIDESDGIIVARGDLGIQLSLKEVPTVQKKLLKEAKLRKKPAIIATQILENMVENPTPTRAEVSDIANSILDGADALLLSDETANGNYPVEAVKVLREVAEITEKMHTYSYSSPNGLMEIEEAVARHAVRIAQNIEAKAIIAFTFSGATARYVSRERPQIPIVALTTEKDTWRKLTLLYGVQSLLVEDGTLRTDDIFDTARKIAFERKYALKGDKIVIVAGIPLFIAGTTNLIKVEKI